MPAGLEAAQYTSLSTVGGRIRKALTDSDCKLYSNKLAALLKNADVSDDVNTFETTAPDAQLDMTELSNRLPVNKLMDLLKTYGAWE